MNVGRGEKGEREKEKEKEKKRKEKEKERKKKKRKEGKRKNHFEYRTKKVCKLILKLHVVVVRNKKTQQTQRRKKTKKKRNALFFPKVEKKVFCLHLLNLITGLNKNIFVTFSYGNNYIIT